MNRMEKEYNDILNLDLSLIHICIVALEFVVDFGWSVQLFFQTVGANQGSRAVHTVEILDFLRYVNVRIGVI